MGCHGIDDDDDDDDNLILFPPKADNSNIFIYSVHVQRKTRPECGTSLMMVREVGLHAGRVTHTSNGPMVLMSSMSGPAPLVSDTIHEAYLPPPF